MSTSVTIASTLINWNDLLKIILTALIGGTGVVIVFGLMLLGISRGKTAVRPATRYALCTLSGVCGLVVVAVAAVGIYAMTQKPSSATPKPKAAASLAPTACGAGESPAQALQPCGPGMDRRARVWPTASRGRPVEPRQALPALDVAGRAI